MFEIALRGVVKSQGQQDQEFSRKAELNHYQLNLKVNGDSNPSL